MKPGATTRPAASITRRPVRARRDRPNLAVADTDAPDRVESRFRIDDAAVYDDEVKLLRGGRTNGVQRESSHEEHAEDDSSWVHDGRG